MYILKVKCETGRGKIFLSMETQYLLVEVQLEFAVLFSSVYGINEL
jgi:hypothetical protein